MISDLDPQELERLSKAATQGVWEVDSEYDNDALYSGGGGCGRGFNNYFIGADVGGKWKTLLDTVNSDQKLIEEEYAEDGKYAWDVIGQANAAFIAALVNAYRTGRLVPAQPSVTVRSFSSSAFTMAGEAVTAQPSGDVVEAVAREALLTALHDAINAPKGVVPASAEAFYDPTQAALRAKEAGDV